MKQTYKHRLAALTVCSVLLTSAGGLLPHSAWYDPAQTAAAAGSLLAFPGATGAGRYATGGRGGEIYHVTNLNDSGAGSLRDAVSKPNRIVVFDVSGTIELAGNIVCSDNITVAGQTAPGGSGVTLKNYKFGMGGDNIICRFLSSRPGPDKCTSSGNDGWGGAKGSYSIVDHCSLGWTTDEQWGLYSNNEYYTVQYSVIGPANSWGGHVKGVHGFGIMLGKGYLSFDHNLIIHNVSRNFRGKTQGTETADFTNNIIYDWGYQTTYGTIGHLNYVNNTLKAGNSTTGGYHWMYVDSGTSPQNFKVYCAGNRLINKDGSFHAVTGDNWSGVTVKESIGITKNDLYSASPFATTLNGENVSTATTCESAEASYDHVITYAGNGISSDKRTAIDRQCADETKNGTGQCSGTEAFDSSVSELTKYNIKCGVTYQYPGAVLKKEIVDTDNDGMPDDWELARGLNPNDGTDYKGDYLGEGYMNLEYYINDLTVDAFPAGTVTLSPEAAPVDPISAYETIEAESYSSMSGIVNEEGDTETHIGFVEAGDYIGFRNVAFGEDGAKSMTARVSGNPCTIELYTGSVSGTSAATYNFAGTGSYSTWTDISFNIGSITGLNNIYLKFTGGDGSYLLNMDSFVFSKEQLTLNGRLIGNVKITDLQRMNLWSIADNTQTGDLLFNDRDVTYAALPDVLRGAERLVTPCDAKYNSGDSGEMTALSDADIYIALDNRVTAVPAFMAGFEKTGLTCANSMNVTFDLYKKSFAAGEALTLGAQGQFADCVFYTVFAVAAAAETTTTTETTTTVTETTTTETALSSDQPGAVIWGDADCSGLFELADCVLLAKAASGTDGTELTVKGRSNSDLFADGTIDSNDLRVILQLCAGIYENSQMPVKP